MAQLDLDTFEDVIEAVGVLLSDAEATEALNTMPKNQMRAYALSDVLSWYVSAQLKRLLSRVVAG